MLRTGSARVLDQRDLDEVLALLDRDPVADCFLASRVGSAGLDSWRLGAEVWGFGERGRLESVCYSGANLVPAQAGPEAVRAFAERARRQGRRCSSIVGSQRGRRPPLAPARAELGARPRRPVRAAPARPVRPTAGRPRPAGAGGAAGRDRDAAAGLRRDVHRGDRGLAAAGRRRRPLPRPRAGARRPGPRLGARRGRRRPVQGRGGRRERRGLPGPGRVGAPGAARAGPGRRGGRRGRRGGPDDHRARRSASTSTTTTPPPAGPTRASGSRRSARFTSVLF